MSSEEKEELKPPETTYTDIIKLKNIYFIDIHYEIYSWATLNATQKEFIQSQSFKKAAPTWTFIMGSSPDGQRK